MLPGRGVIHDGNSHRYPMEEHVQGCLGNILLSPLSSMNNSIKAPPKTIPLTNSSLLMFIIAPRGLYMNNEYLQINKNKNSLLMSPCFCQ